MARGGAGPMGLGRAGPKSPRGAEPAPGAAGSSPGAPGRFPRSLLPYPAEHKLLSAGPTEPWSIREKLCLASSVMRSGDQNWYGSGEGGRQCAEQRGTARGCHAAASVQNREVFKVYLDILLPLNYCVKVEVC